MAKTFGSVCLRARSGPSLPRKETPGHPYTISPRGPVRRGPSRLPGSLVWTGAAQVPFVVMDIAQLIDLSLTGVDQRSVQVMALEPADVSAEAVAGLTGVLTEMSGILVVTGSVDRIRASGSWSDDIYVISLSAGAAGISGDGVKVLNRLLDDPGLAMGLASVARSCRASRSRHPGGPGGIRHGGRGESARRLGYENRAG